MPITISQNRTEEILDAMEDGFYGGISLEEYMQVSFLMLMSGDEQHVEERIMYGGNVFELHACVGQVSPSVSVKSLRKKV